METFGVSILPSHSDGGTEGPAMIAVKQSKDFIEKDSTASKKERLAPITAVHGSYAPTEEIVSSGQLSPFEEIASLGQLSPLEEIASLVQLSPLEEIASLGQLSPLEGIASLGQLSPLEEIASLVQLSPFQSPQSKDTSDIRPDSPLFDGILPPPLGFRNKEPPLSVQEDALECSPSISCNFNQDECTSDVWEDHFAGEVRISSSDEDTKLLTSSVSPRIAKILVEEKNPALSKNTPCNEVTSQLLKEVPKEPHSESLCLSDDPDGESDDADGESDDADKTARNSPICLDEPPALKTRISANLSSSTRGKNQAPAHPSFNDALLNYRENIRKEGSGGDSGVSLTEKNVDFAKFVVADVSQESFSSKDTSAFLSDESHFFFSDNSLDLSDKNASSEPTNPVLPIARSSSPYEIKYADSNSTVDDIVDDDIEMPQNNVRCGGDMFGSPAMQVSCEISENFAVTETSGMVTTSASSTETCNFSSSSDNSTLLSDYLNLSRCLDKLEGGKTGFSSISGSSSVSSQSSAPKPVVFSSPKTVEAVTRVTDFSAPSPNNKVIPWNCSNIIPFVPSAKPVASVPSYQQNWDCSAPTFIPQSRTLNFNFNPYLSAGCHFYPPSPQFLRRLPLFNPGVYMEVPYVMQVPPLSASYYNTPSHGDALMNYSNNQIVFNTFNGPFPFKYA